MQIVPVSRRFRQKVLQFVFFFFHPVPLSNDPGYWFQKMCKRTQNDRGNFQRRFMIISKNARLKEVLSDYQKWRFQFQILQILTCTIVTQNVDGKFHRHFQGIAENFHRRLLIMQKKQKVFWHQSEARTAATVGTGLVRHCPQGLFSPFFTFLRVIFFRPFRLSLVPTICPWVSEEGPKSNLSKMVWHFIGVYIINKTLHGRFEIRNFSSRVEHSKRNFVSPRGHVISSIGDIQFSYRQCRTETL